MYRNITNNRWVVFFLFLWSSTILKASNAQEIFLGNFNTRAHLVAGEVYLLNEKVIEIRNFVYDGEGPAAFFWVDKQPNPTAAGRVAADAFPSLGCARDPVDTDLRLPEAQGIVQRVEFPDELTINDYLGGSLSVWCEQFDANFGELTFPSSLETVPEVAEELECGPLEIFLGPLETRAHLVAGDVYLLGEGVIEIRNFIYDGEGPAAFFWADTQAVPTSGGSVIPDASPSLGCAMDALDVSLRLPRAEGIVQRVEFPAGMSVRDYLGGSISVWCEQFAANFGFLTLPDTIKYIPSPGPLLECVPQGVFLGPLITRAHLVAGDVYMLSEKAIEIRNFVYDGEGPAAFFWADTQPEPTNGGLVIPDGSPSLGCAMDHLDVALRLPRAEGITQRVEFPTGMSILDFAGGSISVWCEQFDANFGFITLPEMFDSIPENGPELECALREVYLGPLETRAHLVAGEVYLLSENVLEIRDFVYDGEGPAAFFWVDEEAVPTNGGEVAPDGFPSLGCAMDPDGTPLPRAAGVVQRVELPNGKTIQDYFGGSLSVWCEQFDANFGFLTFPGSIEEIPSPGPSLECIREIPAIAKTPDGFNCEAMTDAFQVRWKIDGENLMVEMVGKIEDDMYMSFGVSGLPQEQTWMIGADAMVVDMATGTARAQDIFMDSRAQCNGQNGVCPDEDMSFTNDVMNVSGEKDAGLTLVRYTRPLVPTDDGQVSNRNEAVDMSIPTTAGIETFIVWALGPISEVGNPLFHSGGYARQDGIDVSLDFGREVKDNCEPLAVIEGPGEVPTPEPFERPLIGDSDDTTEFVAHIGPSGGDRGYTAITGRASWGIAWYMNGYLIPKLTMRRGTTYTFRISGGFDENDDANYHPFYLTDSAVGGYIQLNATAKKQETVFAGIEITEETETEVLAFEATAVAPICRYEKTPATTEEVESGPYDDYFDTLDTSCARDPAIVDEAAVFTFTPDETTPDTIYYHCVTHRNLGFEIAVIDEDAPKLTDGAQPQEGFQVLELTQSLQGSSLQYKVNTADPRAEGQDTVTIMVTVPSNGWVGFGFNDNGGSMVGSEAVIGLPDSGEVLKYSLGSQLPSGVTPLADAKQTLIDSSISQSGGSTTLSFTKILVEEGEIPIVANGQNTFLTAYGASNTLGFHSAREPFILNLASGGTETVVVGRQSLWKAHGWFASIAWGFLSPCAIGASLLRKFLPGEGLWFQIHRTFNIMVVLFTVIAFGLAVAAVNAATPDGADANHFNSEVGEGHRTIGLVIFILALIQALNGMLRPHLPSKPDTADEEVGEQPADPPEKSGARKGWEVGHRVLGLVCLALCWYQVQLGIKRYFVIYPDGEDEDLFLRLFWGVVGSIAGIVVVGHLASRASN